MSAGRRYLTAVDLWTQNLGGGLNERHTRDQTGDDPDIQ